MKWKTYEPECHVDKERRQRLVFALKPRVCKDGFTRWFCFVAIEEAWDACSWDRTKFPHWKEVPFSAIGLEGK